jgi:hypothetical protein
MTTIMNTAMLSIAKHHFPAAVRVEHEGDCTTEAYRAPSGRDTDESDQYLGYVLIRDGLTIEVADAAFTHWAGGGDDLRYDGEHIIRPDYKYPTKGQRHEDRENTVDP